MAILVEALSVVIKDSSLQTKYIGGIKEFFKTIPNKTYCSDGNLHRLGFMRPQDTEAFVMNLERNGLIFLLGNYCVDFAIVDMLRGSTMNCQWLGFTRHKFFRGLSQYKHSEEEFSIAWIVDRSSNNKIPVKKIESEIAVPKGWSPDKAIYGNNFVQTDKVKETLIEVGSEEGVLKFQYSTTGEFVYIGKPRIKFSDNTYRN